MYIYYKNNTIFYLLGFVLFIISEFICKILKFKMELGMAKKLNKSAPGMRGLYA